MITCYMLFFIHIGSRRVYIVGCTPNPGSTWVAQQARNFSMFLDGAELQCKNNLFTTGTRALRRWTRLFESTDIEIVKTPPHTPVCNAFAERFVREVRETLDNLVIFGQPFYRYVLKNIEKHHNEMRPHQSIGNMIPQGYEYPDTAAKKENREVVCDELLGGLLRHYHLKKAA